MLLIYKYMLKQFLNTLVFSLMVLCVIFVVVNLLENLDDFMDAKASFEVILKYYVYFIPDIMKVLTPVAVLVSSLFTVGKMSNLNEITAMKTGGMSLYKIMFPFVVVCGLLSFGQVYFNGWLVPKANEAKYYIDRKYLDAKGTAPINNFYYRDAPNRNLVMMYYEPDNHTASDVAIEYFAESANPRLEKRISAKTMRWDEKSAEWTLIDVIIRRFENSIVMNDRVDSMKLKLNVAGDEVQKMQKKPDQMTFAEYREYLDFLQRGGKDITKLEVEYYANYAFPFANIIVIFFSIPFASVKKKNGIAVQIAAAMIVAFSYLIFTKVGQSLGTAMAFNPVLSGWLANIIFILVGLGILFRTKT